MLKSVGAAIALICAASTVSAQSVDPPIRGFGNRRVAPARIEAEATRMMREASVQGLAMAVIDEGRVVFTRSWGYGNVEKQLPLQTDTIMYGASLTKLAFAYMVMQLVDEGRLDLDRSIATYLPKPLPEYSFYEALKGDERWRKLTPRILLSHSSGLANFAFLEPDQKMRLHFEPGSRYSYSGEGFILLQFVLETGLGLEVGDEMHRRVFDRFGMARTSMMWRADFADNLADGYAMDGSFQAHDKRSRPRAAGSMDTTIDDFARFMAGFSRGDGLSRKSRAEMVTTQLPITTPTQFPTLVQATSPAMRAIQLSAGLGLINFQGPAGRAFFKGGHNDTTANQAICVQEGRRCVVFLSNDVRAESLFQPLTEATLGESGMPWSWEGYVPYTAQQVDLSPMIRKLAPVFSGTVLAAKANQVVFHQSFGHANRAFEVPNSNDTRYRIASITKLFTAVLTLQLHQEGRLKLDEPIQTYLPACRGPLGSAVTLHHLLTHTSGMADIVAIKSKEQGVKEGIDLYQRPYTADEIVAKYCAAPARDRPGAAFFYNNGDYAVLGKIIEAVEQRPFATVLSRRVLEPLGMTNTGMHHQHHVVPKLADTYFTRDDRSDALANDLPVYTENWYAAGAMYSTAGDLLRFAEALFTGRLLEPASLALLMKRGLDGYGYGAWIYEDVVAGRKLTSLMRPGQIMGVNTVLYRVIEPGVTVIVLSNTDKTNVDALAHQLSKELTR